MCLQVNNSLQKLIIFVMLCLLLNYYSLSVDNNPQLLIDSFSILKVNSLTSCFRGIFGSCKDCKNNGTDKRPEISVLQSSAVHMWHVPTPDKKTEPCCYNGGIEMQHHGGRGPTKPDKHYKKYKIRDSGPINNGPRTPKPGAYGLHCLLTGIQPSKLSSSRGRDNCGCSQGGGSGHGTPSRNSAGTGSVGSKSPVNNSAGPFGVSNQGFEHDEGSGGNKNGGPRRPFDRGTGDGPPPYNNPPPYPEGKRTRGGLSLGSGDGRQRTRKSPKKRPAPRPPPPPPPPPH
ncbi:hypothetical protein FG386_003053 [Cryptosporidium ryanae]|uniref:uncharacterized protein n=1 Tax=Cryptosporidium ryanae TaxID=515981 RepID=UPI00351A2D7A|nr:hypothetical protein FG386_003053 [Cryptosporidium ryanae]